MKWSGSAGLTAGRASCLSSSRTNLCHHQTDCVVIRTFNPHEKFFVVGQVILELPLGGEFSGTFDLSHFVAIQVACSLLGSSLLSRYRRGLLSRAAHASAPCSWFATSARTTRCSSRWRSSCSS